MLTLNMFLDKHGPNTLTLNMFLDRHGLNNVYIKHVFR